LTPWTAYRAYVIVTGGAMAAGAFLGMVRLVRRRRRWPARSRLVPTPHLERSAAVMHADITGPRPDDAVARRHLAELAHLDRVAGMGQLASSIAHELSQPLAAILSHAQAALRLLRMPTPDLNELRACLQDIVSDDRRASDVIRQMRRLLRNADVEALPLALNDLVAATVGLVANDALLRGVSMRFTPAPSLPVIYGNLVQIQQVVLNLLSNAIDAAAAGRAPRTVSVRTVAVSPDALQVVVRDSGNGIADSVRPRVFEPFFTTKPGGLGMGLAISRKIVEVHGGRLDAVNDPAGGAVFTMQLPVRPPDTDQG
jgi:two-component system sensor kinase FixL